MRLEKKLIGIRIMQKRKEKGLSQEELAETIGFSKNHLSSIERGKYIPTTKFICKICNELGETPDYYLIGKISEDCNEVMTLIKSLPTDQQKTLSKLLKFYIEEINNS